MLKKAIAAAALTAQLATSLPSQAYFGQQAIENIASLPAKAASWVKEHPYKTVAIFGGMATLGAMLNHPNSYISQSTALIYGAASLGLATLYHTNPNRFQTGGDGQDLGYIIMIGDDIGRNNTPTTPYQKNLFSQTLKGAIQSRLPKAKFYFVDGINMQEWQNYYDQLSAQGATKVNNIICGHGARFDYETRTTTIEDSKNDIIFDANLKRELFDQYPTIAHELILLSCLSGNVDADALGIPVFSSSKPDSMSIGELMLNSLSYLAHSNHAAPTSAKEFYDMYTNYGASITMTGGTLTNVIADTISYNGLPSIAESFYAFRITLTDTLWPLQSLVRKLSLAFEAIMPYMPLYQDPTKNLNLGTKISHVDYINFGGFLDNKTKTLNAFCDEVLMTLPIVITSNYILYSLFKSVTVPIVSTLAYYLYSLSIYQNL